MMFMKVKFGKYNWLNPFLPNVSFLYILKTLENKKFSDVFRGYKKGTLERKGLKIISNNFSSKFQMLEKLSYIP